MAAIMFLSSHRHSIAACLVAAAIAFVAGRWSVSPSDKENSSASGSVAIRSGISAPGAAAQSRAADKSAIVSGDTMKPSSERLVPILKERNRLARLKRVLDWTESINGKNWREAFDVWMRSGASSAYARDLESRVVLEKIGAMGGAAVLEVIADSSRDVNTIAWRSRYSVAGWAALYPQEATDWILQMQDLPQQPGMMRGEARGGLLEGLCQSDLALARRFSEQVLPGWRDEHFRSIIENIGRSEAGAEGVKDWIETSRQENKDPEFTAQLTSSFVARELERLEAGGGDAGIYEWVASQSTAPGLSPELLGTVAGSMARSQPEQAMEWLSRLPAQALTPETIADSVSRVVSEWQGVRPEGVSAWLAAHPEHPMHGAVQSAAAQLSPPR